MSTNPVEPGPQLPRRGVLRLGAATGAAALLPPSAPALLQRPDVVGAPAPEQLHVQFGADAAQEVVVSWATSQRVSGARLRLLEADPSGSGEGSYGGDVEAQERVYREALTGETVWTYHARIEGLRPATAYRYEALHRGADPVAGRFRTAPRGRAPFRFTSFGDQAIPAAVGAGLGPHSPNAGYVVDAVERLDPLFNLANGDLCYANLSDDPAATWRSYFTTNMPSARNRAWMPAAGNHENEVGNGPHGYRAYQTRFALPANHCGDLDLEGAWYTFTAGNVQVISLNADDVCLQDGGFSAYRRDHVPGYLNKAMNPYVRGYSGGAQTAWLERTLRAAHANDAIDWIVVLMHQVAMSSAHFNGADLGIRQEWLPLFDRYGVDLVLAGHEHHFERTFPVRGTLPGSTLLTPAPQESEPTVMDTSKGAVHMIIGGGGHPSFTPPGAFDAPHDGVVIYDVAAGSPTVQRAARTTTEPAPWSAYRDVTTPYGFASFDVDPHALGGRTTISITHYGAAAGSPVYSPLDTVVLTRPRRHH
jgi:Calcineurin-like phosphoesterase/Purple acid Phosphatase, N-terminal domain